MKYNLARFFRSVRKAIKTETERERMQSVSEKILASIAGILESEGITHKPISTSVFVHGLEDLPLGRETRMEPGYIYETRDVAVAGRGTVHYFTDIIKEQTP